MFSSELPSRYARTSWDSHEGKINVNDMPGGGMSSSLHSGEKSSGHTATSPSGPYSGLAKENEGDVMELLSNLETRDGLNYQGPHSGIAKENEGLRDIKEEPSNLETWDALNYHGRKLWDAFANWNNRKILKTIVANPQVLRTYHDSFLLGEVPLSVRARTLLRSGFIGAVWYLVEFVLALLSGVLYIYSTYTRETGNNWLLRLQNAISIAFFADYILRIYCEPVRLYFIFSFWGLIDLLSTVPIILVFRNDISGASLISLFQFVRIVRIFSLAKKVSLFGSSVMHQIILLTMATFGVIVLDAGILHWVEYHAAPRSKKATCSKQGCITFWEALYFLIVTIATVGYGDLTPKTMMGQLVAIITILAALTILPIQIGRITALAYRRPYGGSFSSRKIVGARFLIISGSITFTEVQTFLAEFYNPTHCEDIEIYPLRVIILAPFAPSFELKQVISLYNGSVEFIEGSPVRQSDLERVSADSATAFFLLADKDADNPQVEDAAQVVRALAVHRFCHANRHHHRVRILVEVLDPETHNSAVWDESQTAGIEVICPVKVHYRMMARSCTVQGLYTLITNLFTSELQLKYNNSKHFLTEYFHSFDNEVYPVVLPSAFHNLLFEEVAEIIFYNYSSILFAVDTVVGYKSNRQADRKVLLYPKGHRINSDDVGIVMASSLHTAYAISTYQHKGEEIGPFRKFWDRMKTTAFIKRDNQGIELLDPSTGKWHRSRSTKCSVTHSGAVVGVQSASFGEFGHDPYPSTPEGVQSASFGELGHDPYPSTPEASSNLEHQLRSVIQSAYSRQEDSDLETEQGGTEIGILQGCDVEAPNLESKPLVGPDEHGINLGRQFPKGISLEKATEQLLAWPPLTYSDRPHPAVVEERQDDILKNLRRRTITMVAFNCPHVLVCCQTGWPVHFFYFLVEIRRPGFPHRPVVILHPKDLTAMQWGAVGCFQDVFFLKGSPHYELDLLRGGVLQAEKIVILSNQGTPMDLSGRRGVEKKYLKRYQEVYMSDIDNIIVAANVQRLYGQKRNENVIVEMQHMEGFYYLRPQYDISHTHFPTTALRRNRDAMVHFGPPFMEGKAVSSAMLGFLMRSSFYNRNTLSIVDQLIGGGYIKTGEGLDTERKRILDQMVIPEEYISRPYSDLFIGLLREKHVLAIGLYRVRGNLGAPTAYVYTNPKPHCIVNPDDLVYILQ